MISTTIHRHLIAASYAAYSSHIILYHVTTHYIILHHVISYNTIILNHITSKEESMLKLDTENDD